MKHLEAEQIALLAAGDLPFAQQARLRWHCVACSECRSQVVRYRLNRQRLKAARETCELPKAFDWQELESSMTANIRLGLEVDAISREDVTEDSQPGIILSFRAAAALAAVTMILLTGWFLSGPGTHPYLMPDTAPVAQVNSGDLIVKGGWDGVEVRHQGSAMLLRTAPVESSNIQVGLEGSVRTASVDAQSGQITVSQVYVE